MHQEKITAIFDHQAATYDQKWMRLASINSTLHLLTSAVLSTLPATARILCVGAGTGAEIFSLAQKFSAWHFTAVEPSAAMVEVLRGKAQEAGIASRVALHQGYLDSLPAGEPYHAATAFLVSQFILERDARSAFFQGIADRLVPGGLLVSADLSGDISATPSTPTPSLLEIWFRVMSDSGALGSPEEIDRMREAYSRDVSVQPPAVVQDIITHGGFGTPLQIFQAGMIHAWVSRRG